MTTYMMASISKPQIEKLREVETTCRTTREGMGSRQRKEGSYGGIPDVIHNYGKPMPLSQLVASLQIHPSKTSFVHRLMRILVHSNFFTTKDVPSNDLEIEIGYVLTDSSMLLLKDNPLSLSPLVAAMLDPIMIKPWNQMSTWFKNDDPTPFVTEYGTPFFDYASHVPKLNEIFNDAMASDARLVSKLLKKSN
ncbi:Trans-resveratrol di-O-methyltransferase [Arachis hypogaea]|uniref:O-methyltransferase dimerisation domain-containing protein n=1 Tax=Arachis hypogaea TaxID=3818 RepID=A0A445C795_ARAHY|nr:Trans-resveratrol di-O-methyltransferase [Arachis hypogaea]RYR46802.1 hypothetical protein Ahy_A07g032626 [Arachis hypogaea]